MISSTGRGFLYLWRGFKLMQQPGLRRYAAVPVLLNAVIFGFLFGLGLQQFNQWLDQLLPALPDWLGFLRWILWPLAALLLLIALGYTFSTCANLLAAPFNGLLAERAEALLTGHQPEAGGLRAACKDAPRAIAKEFLKLFYYLPRVLLVLACSLIPPLYPLVPLLWFVLGAWMMAMEYCDYPMDNHRHSLRDVRRRLAHERFTSMGFGAAVLLGTMVPLLNLFIMPAAVCGATLFWVEKLQRDPCAAAD